MNLHLFEFNARQRSYSLFVHRIFSINFFLPLHQTTQNVQTIEVFFCCLLLLQESNSGFIFYSEGVILGLGNPLLDVSAIVNEEFLKKYGLQPNNAILAGDEHVNLCKEMAEKFKVDYIAGGAAQNTIRVAQWFFSNPRRTAFFGAVGNDAFGQQMRKKAEENNVIVSYFVDPKVPTGTCACLITGKNRSLCAYLGASQKFNIQYLKDNFRLVEQAKIIYTTGFHLMVCFEAQLAMAEHVHASEGKVFSLNLSAPYISDICADQLNRILPYVDLLFGNETEAQAFANMKKWKVWQCFFLQFN